ncbi:MAG: hypothetical protein H6827_09600 [Planctomycetes bacterium]|nr:hypothetical protein [Planctomycetota bacterium]
MFETSFGALIVVFVSLVILKIGFSIKAKGLWQRLVVVLLVCLGFGGVGYAVYRVWDRSKIQEALEEEQMRVAIVADSIADAQRRIDATKIKPIPSMVDTATGCEYLVAPNGSLAPRMDSTGKQVCK